MQNIVNTLLCVCVYDHHEAFCTAGTKDTGLFVCVCGGLLVLYLCSFDASAVTLRSYTAMASLLDGETVTL